MDDVIPLNHTYGCGVAIDAPGAVIPIRTIKNIARNPNFGGKNSCRRTWMREIVT
ncbi:MAG: UxaA family hydrolase [Bacillus subtilis]|nr:UxaA family hydrolase [Bacillus subtilis]